MKNISIDQQSQTQPHAVQPRPADSIRSLLWSGVILGIGTIGSLDEIVLHQLLQWHSFYVHTTLYWRIVSDGVFHLVSVGLLLGGGLRLAWQRPQFGDPMQLRALIAGMLLGMGGFNLYDGTIQHKILQLHPVREGVPNLLLYDLAFNALALTLLLLGWRLWHSLLTGDQRNSV
jgi:uncharacterized membrane protein